MLLVLLAFLLQAWAVPISAGPQTIPTIVHTIVWGIEPRADGNTLADRTMLTIVRSCLLTIAACVYRAIHQNIPDPNASWWKRQAIRLKITFYALMAPEAMIWWAMRQWIGAKEIAKRVNEINPDLGWTRTHGHFAQMGGFGRLDGDQERILYPPTLIMLLKNGQIDVKELRRVTKKRIDDRSKGDILSKGIVALQTTWFVFECIARLYQRLPLIELEVVTLAFATLNTLTYLFWWDKPLDVLCPIYLHILPIPDFEVKTSPSARSNTKSPANSLEQEVALASTEEAQALLDPDDDDVNQQDRKEVVGQGVESVIDRGSRRWLSIWKRLKRPFDVFAKIFRQLKGAIRAGVGVISDDIERRGWWATGVKWLIEEPFEATVTPLRELFDDEGVHDESTYISTFYGMELSKEKSLLVLKSSCSVGILFGAVHFLSWSSPFPTHMQQLIWRISSIILVAQPFCLVIESVLSDGNDEDVLDHMGIRRWIPFFIFAALSLLLGPVLYILARLCVLVLAFVTLCDLPPDAFRVIPWAALIPHL